MKIIGDPMWNRRTGVLFHGVAVSGRSSYQWAAHVVGFFIFWIISGALSSSFAQTQTQTQTEEKPKFYSTDSFATAPLGHPSQVTPTDVSPSLVLDAFTDDMRWRAYWTDWSPPSYEIGTIVSVAFARSQSGERLAFCVTEWSMCVSYPSLPENLLRQCSLISVPIPQDCGNDCEAELIRGLLIPYTGRPPTAEQLQHASPATIESIPWTLPRIDDWQSLPAAPVQTVNMLQAAVRTFVQYLLCGPAITELPALKLTDADAWVYLGVPDKCGGPQIGIFTLGEDNWHYNAAIVDSRGVASARAKISASGATVMSIPAE